MTDPVSSPLLHARLTAHRSMSARSQVLVVALFAVPALALSLVFALHGFWPVTPFLGLDVVLLAVAFRCVRLRRAAYEDVIVGADAIVIRRADGRRAIVEERLPTLWTQLEREEDDDFGCLALRLRRRRRAVVVAAMLSPDERRSFAEVLSEALSRARQGGLAALQPVAVPPQFSITRGTA